MKTVGIIGGSGYIGSHITKIFLQKGFRVKVSTKTISNPDKFKHLSALDNSELVTIVQLEVRNVVQLNNFIDGCDIIIHGGTPYHLDPKDPEADLFDPTVRGTELLLKLIGKAPNLKKVVFIASAAAYNSNFPLLPEGRRPGDTVSERDPRFYSLESHPYAQAKFIAHDRVQRYVVNHPDTEVEITSVLPVGVFGPALSRRQDSTSVSLQHLFQQQIAPNAYIKMFYDRDVHLALVDVADVAEAVYRAAIRTDLHGRSYLLSSESYRISDISSMLNGAPPRHEPTIVYESDRARRELGMKFRPVRTTLFRYARTTLAVHT